MYLVRGTDMQERLVVRHGQDEVSICCIGEEKL